MTEDGSRKYHLIKTISWRVIASFTTFLISWLFTGSLVIGAAIGGTEALIKMVLYYWHERAWHSISHGRV